MRPDAIPVTPLASRATLTRADARALFGVEAFRGTERVEVVRLGEPLATVPVSVGAETEVLFDAEIAITATGEARLVGPLGATSPEAARPVRSRLVAPAALARAWGLGEAGAVVLGPLAAALPVEDGPALALEVERSLWLAAGRPETGAWASGLSLPTSPDAPPAPEATRETALAKRVVTETDVRQALLAGRRIRLRPDQIVTPAALSLGRERGAFAE